MGRDLSALLQRIRNQLDVRGADPAKPLLTEMEHTLTDGYARALELEAERLRLERRIGELAHSLDGPDEAKELRRLAIDLRRIDEILAALRGELAALRQHVDEARAAA
jgi:ABC-type phosphate transport system auxiliary subunit